MRLLRALELWTTSIQLWLILKLSSSYCTIAEVFENNNDSLMDNGNAIDFYNASDVHDVADGYGNSTHRTRAKRFIAFPIGSSFSTAVCMTTGVIGNPNYQYLSMGLNWGIAYDLPNSTWVLQHAKGFGSNDQEEYVSPQIKRRHRRDLYGKLETLINGMGYNGRDCVLRALCESRQYFQKTKMGMIGEMLRVIFSLPKQRIYTRELTENSDIKLYDRAYRKARAVDDCSLAYDCSFSLLELAFGRYSTPPTDYYKQH
ncbi:hypothetical protein DOY81_006243 [Sarcophaga bullata]|nr:hypothetical protein DOY81_006243 [Sarcophaga bullata]